MAEDALSRLLAAIHEFQAREERRVDIKGLREGIDALEGEFAAEAREVRNSGDHLVGGDISAGTWIGRPGGVWRTPLAVRPWSGEHLPCLPKIAAALVSAELLY